MDNFTTKDADLLEEIMKACGILQAVEVNSEEGTNVSRVEKEEEEIEAPWSPLPSLDAIDKAMEDAVCTESPPWSPLPSMEDINAMEQAVAEEYPWSPLPSMEEINAMEMTAEEEQPWSPLPDDIIDQAMMESEGTVDVMDPARWNELAANFNAYDYDSPPTSQDIDKIQELPASPSISQPLTPQPSSSTEENSPAQRYYDSPPTSPMPTSQPPPTPQPSTSTVENSLAKRCEKRGRELEFNCHVCMKTYKSANQLMKHLKQIHQGVRLKCEDCDKEFTSSKMLAHHRLYCSLQPPKKKKIEVQQPKKTTKGQQVGRGKRRSMQNHAQVQEFIPTHNEDILQAMKELERPISIYLQSHLEDNHIKWYMVMQVVFKKPKKDDATGLLTDDFEYDNIYQASENYIATLPENIDDDIPKVFQDIAGKFQEFQRQGSGWSVDHVVNIEVHTAVYDPLYGSSYIPLPTPLKGSRSIINIQNQDQKCFLWCVLAHLHPTDDTSHKYRVSHYTAFEHELDTSNLTYPVPLKQIHTFERRNHLRINVFSFDEDEMKVVPQLLTRQNEGEQINLFMISNEENNHYCLVTNFNGLMNHRRNKHIGTMYYCFNCLHGFIKKENLQKHEPDCKRNPTQRLTFPDEDKEEDCTVSFKSIAKQQPMPFVIYADFECYTQKQEGEEQDKRYQHHIPNSFGYTVVSCVPEYTKEPVIYRGEGDDVIEVFLKKLLEEEKHIGQILSHPKPIDMTAEDKEAFKSATQCSICNKPLGRRRARDHDHLTGKFRGAAHKKCNVNYRLLKKQNIDGKESFVIPVVFHNLRGYDSHHIMQAIGKFKNLKIQVIPNTLEKYISFTLGNLRFIDSLQFMATSLEKLVGNLAQEGKQKFTHMQRWIPDEAQQDLLLRKGVYPYDYVDGPSKLEQTELPPKDDFYSLLSDEHISDDDYQHALNVWREFQCNTLGDYHDLYLKSDVLQLADVFENFRHVCCANYGLDPAHYYTAPGLSWDAMLKMTGVVLEIITDVDMYLMVEKGIRGGVSMISTKYAKANNPHIKDYNSDNPHSYIMYLDANNLYGWAMSQYLPKCYFKWVEDPEELDIMAIPKDAETGYILEVDLEYPDDLHDLHSDYPVAPECKTISKEELSAYSKDLFEELHMKGKPTSKLIPNLHHKEKYVVHYHNLQQYLQLGLKLRKIHRAISFYQDPWLKSYISLNTEKRKQAKNTFEKDFYKLMNNSVFGKTMENVRKRIKVELVHEDLRFRKVVAKPEFRQFKIFNEDLTGVHLQVSNLVLNKPIYVGMSILDISKTLMYDFHYNYIKKKYTDSQLLFTDTDSLCYHIQTDDIYKDILQDAEYFDTSDYPPDHELHSNNNKKVLGKMKDETAGVPIDEFVGLRAKMYSMTYNGKEKKTAKGIGKACMKKTKHASYKDCLLNKKTTTATGNFIRSHAHQVYSETMTKVALSSFDDKRYVLDDGYTTLAHGHYSTQ